MTVKLYASNLILQFSTAMMLVVLSCISAAASTYDFSYSGRLVDATGKPFDGPLSLKVSFFHSENSSTPVLEITSGLSNVTLNDGVFQITMALDAVDYNAVFSSVNQAVYVQITDVTHAKTYDRQRISILPYAGKIPVDGAIFDFDNNGLLSFASNPESGKYLKGNADGSVSWDTPAGGVAAGSTDTFTNKTIDADSNTISNISNTSIKTNAAIADTKLATISTAGKVSGSAITSGTITGTTEVSTSGNIATTAKVGVGVAAGTSQLEVKGGGTTSATSSLNVSDSAGSSKLFVRDDGNVGIGTTNPGSKLEVNGSTRFGNGTGSSQFDFVTRGDYDALRLYSQNNPSGGSVNAPSIGFYRSLSNSVSAAPRFRIEGGPGTWDMDGFKFSSPNSGVDWIAADQQGGYRAATSLMSDVANVMVVAQRTYFTEGTLAVGTDFTASTVPSSGIVRSGQKNGAVTDVEGSNLTLQAGRGTGSSVLGGNLIFQTPDATTSGTSLQAYSTKLQISRDGNVGIGTSTPSSKLNVENGTVLFSGASGTTPISGAGTRMMWIPAKAAFRAGLVDNTSWDDANIGYQSAAFNFDSVASGSQSFSAIRGTASGIQSVAIGNYAVASGTGAIAIGPGALANANGSLSLGSNSRVTASGTNSVAIGSGIDGGNLMANSIANSLAIGFNSTIPTFFVSGSAGAGTSGNVGIGTTSPGYKLNVNGEPGANGYTAFTNYSDRRLKRNINPLANGMLDKVMALKPSSFYYNELSGYDEETRGRKINGFIAQELQQVFPEMVHETKINSKKYFDTNLSALQIYLVKAMQELKTYVDQIFDSQSQRIAKVEAENKDLKANYHAIRAENESMKIVLCDLRPEASFCEDDQQ